MVRNVLVAVVVLGMAFAAAEAADQWKNLTKAKGGLPGDQVQFVEGDEDGNICTIQKSGPAGLTQEEIKKAVAIASERAAENRKLISGTG